MNMNMPLTQFRNLSSKQKELALAIDKREQHRLEYEAMHKEVVRLLAQPDVFFEDVDAAMIAVFGKE